MKPVNYKTVLSKLDEYGVRTITLNRPECLNAMNRQLICDLADAVEHANADPKTRVIILTGAGRAFCAGDDRRAHQHPEDEDAARLLVTEIQRVTKSLLFGAKPVVGAINGWAVGGGFEWAINCDFPIYAESAKAFFPEVSLNLFVTGAVTSILPALVGVLKAREMLLLGEHYDARRLLELGVAWRVVADDQLLKEAENLAYRLAALPSLSTRAMKRVLNQTSVSSLKSALELETDATVAGFMDPKTTQLLKDF
jgi:enoyl-CoA hydratase/carnithine racemase